MEEIPESEMVIKWLWLMDYCKTNRLPPAQSLAWERAKQAYHEHHDAINSNTVKREE